MVSRQIANLVLYASNWDRRPCLLLWGEEAVVPASVKCIGNVCWSYESGACCCRSEHESQKLISRWIFNFEAAVCFSASSHEVLCCRGFMLGPWVRDAEGWAATPAESAQFRSNLLTQITIWGTTGGDPSQITELDGYANRQWSGLMGSYYRVRCARRLHDSLGHSRQSPLPCRTGKACLTCTTVQT